MDERNEMNNMSKTDQEMLDRVEKIVSHEVAPASAMDELCLRLANTITPAAPAFRQQLEARLLAELSQQTSAEDSLRRVQTDSTRNEVEASQIETVSTASIQQNLQRRRRFLNWKKPSSLRTEANFGRRGWPWQRLILAGMAAVTIIFVLGIVGLAALNIGEGTGSTNPQAGSKGNPPTSQPAGTGLLANQLMVLQPASSQVSPDQLEAARQIIEQRVKALSMGDAAVKVQNGKIILEIQNEALAAQFMEKFATQLKVVISTGRLEVIDAGNSVLKPGETVQTTYCRGGTVFDQKPGLCSSKAQAGVLNEKGQPFQTLFTNEQIDPTKNGQTSVGGTINLQFGVQTDTLNQLKKYFSANSMNQIAIVLDRQVLTELPAKVAMVNQLDIPVSNGNAKDKSNVDPAIAVLFKYGPLPFDLEVVSHR